MENDIELLNEYLPQLSAEQIDKCKQYYDILSHFNKTINLVSRISLNESASRHFFDSVRGIEFFMNDVPGGATIYDFGSGNGFPGAISALLFPNVKHILVERDKRKSQFLKFISEEVGLNNVILHDRLVSELKEGSVLYGMSRAMAPLPKMLLELRHLTKSGSRIYLFKGDTWTTEFGNCPPQIFDLWDVQLKGDYILPKVDMSRFIVECVRL